MGSKCSINLNLKAIQLPQPLHPRPKMPLHKPSVPRMNRTSPPCLPCPCPYPFSSYLIGPGSRTHCLPSLKQKTQKTEVHILCLLLFLLLLFIIFISSFYMMSVLPACMTAVHHGDHEGKKKGRRSLGACSCESPCECWESNPGPLRRAAGAQYC